MGIEGFATVNFGFLVLAYREKRCVCLQILSELTYLALFFVNVMHLAEDTGLLETDRESQEPV